MSIAPISGASSLQSFSAASSARRPESGETPGAADHDSDSDNASVQSTSAGASSASASGRVDVKA